MFFKKKKDKTKHDFSRMCPDFIDTSEPPQPIFNEKFNLLIVSDIHYTVDVDHIFDEMKKRGIDTFHDIQLCIFLGDVPNFVIKQVKNKINCKCIGVFGDYDSIYTYDGIDIENINRKLYDFNGLTIAGIEGSSRYKNSKEYIMHTQEESMEIQKNFDKVDILIAHDSPFERYSKEKGKCGLQGISECIRRCQPKVCLCGHHHIWDEFTLSDTKCFCVYQFGVFSSRGTLLPMV